MVKLKIWVLQSMYVLIDKTVKWSRYEDSGGLYVPWSETYMKITEDYMLSFCELLKIITVT